MKAIIISAVFAWASVWMTACGPDHTDKQAHQHQEADHNHTGEQAHDHEQEGAHVHAEDEHIHNGTTESHDHQAEGLITVEGDWEILVGLKTTTALTKSIEQMITVPGQIIADQNRIALVNPFIEGSLNCVFVNLGDRVDIGDELLCMTSPEIGMLRAEYDKARAELEIQRQDFMRKESLFKENVISQRAFQEAELAKRIAEVQHEYAMKKLLAVGVTQAELDTPPTGHSEAVGSTIHIHAPIAGVITARDASIGQKAGPNDRLLEIVDLSKVWCEADIFEKDLVQIRLKQRVKLQVAAYPGEYFDGSIIFIGSTLHPVTKTVKVMVGIRNMDEKLKPGMFAQTGIVVGTKKDALVVPSKAVLDDEQLQVVFVKEPGGYHRHVVQTGILSPPFVEIVSGLEPGALIVTEGAYQLRSKMRMTGVDPHAGHVH